MGFFRCVGGSVGEPSVWPLNKSISLTESARTNSAYQKKDL